MKKLLPAIAAVLLLCASIGTVFHHHAMETNHEAPCASCVLHQQIGQGAAAAAPAFISAGHALEIVLQPKLTPHPQFLATGKAAQAPPFA